MGTWFKICILFRKSVDPSKESERPTYGEGRSKTFIPFRPQEKPVVG